MSDNPYDELPYRSFPIEWSAPERLAVTSMLQGGPRPPLDSYRALEVGCGDGTNLVALAYYRQHATFVGIDGSARHIECARRRAEALELDNVVFVHADLRDPDPLPPGQFDYMIAHGVLSWVPDDARDAILRLLRSRLADGGVGYLNYNTHPGWSVRGMVREFLMPQTDASRMPAAQMGLRARTEAAQGRAAQLAETLQGSEHPWGRLLAQEFELVARADTTYVAHEYLNPYNRAYWRSDFVALAATHGLVLFGEADLAHVAGRGAPELDEWLAGEGIVGRSPDDTSDLIRYRQLHSPLFTAAPFVATPPTDAEIGALLVASTLTEVDAASPLPSRFERPSVGDSVDVSDETTRAGLRPLAACWPRGRRVAELFADLGLVREDLLLMHRYGLVELRRVEPDDFVARHGDNRLHVLEDAEGRPRTSVHHR